MMVDPLQTRATQRFLVKVLQRTSDRLRMTRVQGNGRATTQTFEASAQWWDALRTVGLSNLKVEL